MGGGTISFDVPRRSTYDLNDGIFVAMTTPQQPYRRADYMATVCEVVIVLPRAGEEIRDSLLQSRRRPRWR